jgi:NADPH:quinone reductase-like Zn-dependent oxidoreductase
LLRPLIAQRRNLNRTADTTHTCTCGVRKLGSACKSAVLLLGPSLRTPQGINVLNRADAVVLEDLARRVDAGELRAPVQRTYEMTKLSVAFQDLQTEHTQGKIAIAFD